MGAHFKLEFYLLLCSLCRLIQTQKQSQMKDSKLLGLHAISQVNKGEFEIVFFIFAPDPKNHPSPVQNFIYAPDPKLLSGNYQQ